MAFSGGESLGVNGFIIFSARVSMWPNSASCAGSPPRPITHQLIGVLWRPLLHPVQRRPAVAAAAKLRRTHRSSQHHRRRVVDLGERQLPHRLTAIGEREHVRAAWRSSSASVLVSTVLLTHSGSCEKSPNQASSRSRQPSNHDCDSGSVASRTSTIARD